MESLRQLHPNMPLVLNLFAIGGFLFVAAVAILGYRKESRVPEANIPQQKMLFSGLFLAGGMPMLVLFVALQFAMHG